MQNALAQTVADHYQCALNATQALGISIHTLNERVILLEHALNEATQHIASLDTRVAFLGEENHLQNQRLAELQTVLMEHLKNWGEEDAEGRRKFLERMVEFLGSPYAEVAHTPPAMCHFWPSPQMKKIMEMTFNDKLFAVRECERGAFSARVDNFRVKVVPTTQVGMKRRAADAVTPPPKRVVELDPRVVEVDKVGTCDLICDELKFDLGDPTTDFTEFINGL